MAIRPWPTWHQAGVWEGGGRGWLAGQRQCWAMAARGAVATGGATTVAAVAASAAAQQPRERLRDFGRERDENEKAKKWMRIALNFGPITIDSRPHL